MKSQLLTFVILIMVVSTSIFGLTLMDHRMDHKNNKCAVSMVFNLVCPDNQLLMAQYHAAAVKGFSDIVIPQVVMFALTLLVVVAVSPYLLEYLARLSTLKPQRFYTEQNQKYRYFDEKLHWLSRFEISPSFAI